MHLIIAFIVPGTVGEAQYSSWWCGLSIDDGALPLEKIAESVSVPFFVYEYSVHTCSHCVGVTVADRFIENTNVRLRGAVGIHVSS